MARPEKKYSFGRFELDCASGELFRDGERMPLQGKPVAVLALLVERAGDLVTRDELKADLWSADTFVDFDNNLNAAVRKLREALGDSADAPCYIETLPRRGYRFVAALGTVDSPDTVISSPRREDAAPDAVHRTWRPVALSAGAVAGALTVLALLGIAAPFWPTESVPETQQPVRLAVLPFENLSGDAAQDIVGDGLGAELVGQLGTEPARRFRLVSRSSTHRYRGSSKSASEIGQELTADFLVEGSTRQDAGGLHVTAHLVRARDGEMVWNGSFTCPSRDLFAIQRQLATKIGGSLVNYLTP